MIIAPSLKSAEPNLKRIQSSDIVLRIEMVKIEKIHDQISNDCLYRAVVRVYAIIQDIFVFLHFPHFPHRRYTKYLERFNV